MRTVKGASGCNAAEMRDALMEIVITATKAGATMGYDVACGIIKSKAKHALSKPPRNCDVGSANEQEQRFSEFCEMNMNPTGDCSNCPTYRYKTQCEFAWAQMPYEAEKGGAK